MGRKFIIANTVDHRVPISEGGDPFPGHDGLSVLLSRLSWREDCTRSRSGRDQEHEAEARVQPGRDAARSRIIRGTRKIAQS